MRWNMTFGMFSIDVNAAVRADVSSRRDDAIIAHRFIGGSDGEEHASPVGTNGNNGG